jgi:hypothetical protein
MRKTRIIITGLIVIVFCLNINGQSVPYRIKNLWGLSDLKGNIISPAKYDSIEFINPHFNRARVWKAKKMGMINEKGQEIISPVYDDVTDRYDYIRVINNKKSGMFSVNGKNILPIQYDEFKDENYNFVIIRKNSKEGIARVINGKSTIKQNVYYDSIKFIYPENVFECYIKGNKKYLDTAMKTVKYNPMEMDYVMAEEEGNYSWQDEIEKQRQEREIENNMFLTRNLQNNDIVLKKDSGLFKVVYERKQGFWGVRKCDGKILVPYLYEDFDLKNSDLQDIHSNYRQLYILKYKGKWGMIGHKNRNASNYKDTTTYHLIDFKYDSIYCNTNCTSYITRDNGKFGIIAAKDFNIIIPPKYLYIQSTYEELNNQSIFWVKDTNGKFGYVNENGLEYFKD